MAWLHLMYLDKCRLHNNRLFKNWEAIIALVPLPFGKSSAIRINPSQCPSPHSHQLARLLMQPVSTSRRLLLSILQVLQYGDAMQCAPRAAMLSWQLRVAGVLVRGTGSMACIRCSSTAIHHPQHMSTRLSGAQIFRPRDVVLNLSIGSTLNSYINPPPSPLPPSIRIHQHLIIYRSRSINQPTSSTSHSCQLAPETFNMKFSVAAISLAAVAVASPTSMEARTNPPSGGTCSINGDNNGKVTCCNSAIPILGQLLCNVLAIGNTCNSGQSVYCCKTDATGGLINVSLLNCVNIL